jgi:hypothetical protein
VVAAWLALLALRLPNHRIPIINVDEADFVVEANVLLDGGRPYVDFVEKKPPLIYVLYAGGMALVGRYQLPAMRVLLIPWILLTALFVSLIARRIYGERQGLLALPLYAIAVSVGPPLDMHAVNAESLFLLPLVAGTWLALGERPLRWLAAGVLLACSALVKQQAGMQLPIVAAFLILHLRGRARWQAPALLCGGFLVTCLAAVAVLVAIGSWGEFLYWTVAVNRYYIGNGNSFGDGLRLMVRALLELVPASPGFWLFGEVWLGLAIRRVSQAASALTLISFCGSCLPLSLGGRFFPHYFLQLFPPLAILASMAAVELWDRARRFRRPRIAVAAATVAGLVVWPAVGWTRDGMDVERVSIPHAVPDARRLAAYIQRETAPDARILVWGYGSAIYYLSERRPATRFPYVTYLVGAVEGTPSWWNPFVRSAPLEIPRAWDLLFEDLARHPPELVIDTAKARYFAFWKFPPSRYPRLQRYLDQGYERTEVAGFPVWRRRP